MKKRGWGRFAYFNRDFLFSCFLSLNQYTHNNLYFQRQMMKYKNIREESLKLKVASDFFSSFDTTEIVGNIDFCVKPKQIDLFSNTAPLVWAEAKKDTQEVTEMITQLILTIGKARTFDKTLPPAFLWCFDFEKIAFVEYLEIQDIFYENDFNRNVTPSNHDTKEFQKVRNRIEGILKKKTWIFDYEKDEKRLKDFIQNTIGKVGSGAKIKINKNNFLPIYLKWLEVVKPEIDVNREELKKNNILDSDFFLADLFVDDRGTDTINDDVTVKNDLFVRFEDSGYKITRENLKSMFDAIIKIKNQKVYEFFRKNYKRPPAEEYQKYIINRRDLIVPQDIRERKGAFFTPRIWVEKSQEYLANYFGENYQEEYYIRDCAAGTGNLLAWLTNKYNIYASTLDTADVNVMKEMIKEKSINLLENHVFQFDFLNDDFSKLPESLQEIINDEEKRKKLIVYINPPYAEASNHANDKKDSEKWNKAWTTIENETYKKYKSLMGKASNELFTQFLIRIYKEIPWCKIGEFSKLKHLQGSNFKEFRNEFQPKLESCFVVPWNTFDNVTWNFPIWFFIWDCLQHEQFIYSDADIFDKNWQFIGIKTIWNFKDKKINNWYSTYYDQNNTEIGVIHCFWNDFQTQNYIRITSDNDYNHTNIITKNNIIHSSIYLAVRQCIEATRLNDRDQFLRPKDEREKDLEFQNDCLTFTLFHWQNRITSRETWVNHWIPFTEDEVDAREKFASHFMTDFLKGREFSPEAKAVFDAWRELWRYYHEKAWDNPFVTPWHFPLKGASNSANDVPPFQRGMSVGQGDFVPWYLVNASLYEIREYFQGRNEKGKMNVKSDDMKYMELIGALRSCLKVLGDKIAEKVYEYEFLKR